MICCVDVFYFAGYGEVGGSDHPGGRLRAVQLLPRARAGDDIVIDVVHVINLILILSYDP